MIIKPRITSETVVRLFIVILLTTICIRYGQSRLELSDLKVYYGATRKLLGWSLDPTLFGSSILNNADHNPYHFYYGLTSGYYKYAPFFLLLFSVFAAIPWSVLLLLYPALCLVGFYFLYRTLKGLFLDKFFLATQQEKNYLDKSIMLCVILQSHNIYREILIGNINLFLMLILIYFLIFYCKGKLFTSSLFLSLLVLIKPHFVFIFCLLFFHKQYRTILCSGVISFLLLASPVPFWGYQISLNLMGDWIHAMQAHNNVLSYLSNPLNIQFILWHLCLMLGIDKFSINKSLFVNAIILIVPLIIFIRFCYVSSLKKQTLKGLQKDSQFMAYAFSLASIIPFIFLVDTNQLIYIFPFSIFLTYKYFFTIKHLYKTKLKICLATFAMLYIFTILTQQIPSGWFALNKLMGFAYLLLLSITYLTRNARNSQDLFYLER